MPITLRNVMTILTNMEFDLLLCKILLQVENFKLTIFLEMKKFLVRTNCATCQSVENEHIQQFILRQKNESKIKMGLFGTFFSLKWTWQHVLRLQSCMWTKLKMSGTKGRWRGVLQSSMSEENQTAHEHKHLNGCQAQRWKSDGLVPNRIVQQWSKTQQQIYRRLKKTQSPDVNLTETRGYILRSLTINYLYEPHAEQHCKEEWVKSLKNDVRDVLCPVT